MLTQAQKVAAKKAADKKDKAQLKAYYAKEIKAMRASIKASEAKYKKNPKIKVHKTSADMKRVQLAELIKRSKQK